MRIGIDLGGTKIEGIALDDHGNEIFRQRIPTPRDYEATVDTVTKLVQLIEKETGQTGTVGMGIPGTISPATGLVKNANSTWLIGKPLTEALQEKLQREVRIENDANCFAVSEATDGAAAGAHVVFGVIIGTGVGGGICIDKIPLVGVNAIGGEWGHNPLPWAQDDERPGHPCFCGHPGCIETFCSGTGFVRDYQQHGGQAEHGREIVALAEQGDDLAEQALKRYEHRLARALSHLINILDPDVIVLGGGMSNVDRLYETIPQIWNEFVFSDRVDTKLVKNKYGDSSGVRGAAWLWPSD
ncbi:MAG: fructokinase [Gammaproteobacteria bacterium]|nr:fructokinase [Gammaproteobacteria bacterium]